MSYYTGPTNLATFKFLYSSYLRLQRIATAGSGYTLFFMLTPLKLFFCFCIRSAQSYLSSLFHKPGNFPLQLGFLVFFSLCGLVWFTQTLARLMSKSRITQSFHSTVAVLFHPFCNNSPFFFLDKENWSSYTFKQFSNTGESTT